MRFSDSQLLESILAYARFGVAVMRGADHKVVFANPMLRQLASDHACLIGQPLGAALVVEQAEAVLRRLDQVAATRRAARLKRVEVAHAQGRSFWDMELVPLASDDGAVEGILLMAFDVTPEVISRLNLAAATALAEDRAAEIEAIMNCLQEGVVVARGEQVEITAISPYAARRLGRDAEPQIGRSLAEHARDWGLADAEGKPMDPNTLPLALAVRQGQVTENRELTITASDGSLIPVLVSAAPVRDATGRVRGGTVLWRDISELKRTQEALHRAVAEKDRLMAELNHRVKNNLETVLAMLSLQAGDVADPATRAELHKAMDRVESIGVLHRALHGRDYDGRIEISQPFADLFSTHPHGAPLHGPVDGPGVDLALDVERMELPLDQATPLLLLVNELVGNALRHGFPKGWHGRVEISLCRPADGLVELAVRDNGLASVQRSGRMGLTLARALAHQLGSPLHVSREGGWTVMRLVFPFEGQGGPRLRLHQRLQRLAG